MFLVVLKCPMGYSLYMFLVRNDMYGSFCLFVWSLMTTSPLFSHIFAVGPPNRLSWITNQWSPISPQVTKLLISHDFWINIERQMTIRLFVRDQLARRNNAWPEDRTSIPGLQIQLSTYWGNRTNCIEVIICRMWRGCTKPRKMMLG